MKILPTSPVNTNYPAFGKISKETIEYLKKDMKSRNASEEEYARLTTVIKCDKSGDTLTIKIHKPDKMSTCKFGVYDKKGKVQGFFSSIEEAVIYSNLFTKAFFASSQTEKDKELPVLLDMLLKNKNFDHGSDTTEFIMDNVISEIYHQS